MSALLTLEQKVRCLNTQVGQVKEGLLEFLQISEVSLQKALSAARTLIEYFVGCILLEEGIKAEGELLSNIEILGAKDGKDAAKRRKNPQSPIPPPVLRTTLYSSLHNLRIYGNLVVHPWDPQTMELKDAHLTSIDLQIVLGQVMRLVEWFFTEYKKPPLDPLYDGVPEPVLGKFCDVPPDTAGFRGRERELDELGRLLRGGPARVITVAAAAGIGKTALAARAASALVGEEHHRGGLLLWLDLKAAPSFVEVSARILASLQEGATPADISIAQLSPSARVGQIVRRMAERPVLLVLDNLESWLEPRTGRPFDPAVAQLLDQCATRDHCGRILLTSRRVADVPGLPPTNTTELILGPLDRPAADAFLQAQGLTGSEKARAAVYAQMGGNPRLLLLLAEVLLKRRCPDMDQGLKRFPGLVRDRADGLLTEIWSELSDNGRLILQALAVLRSPATPAEIAGTLSGLMPQPPVDIEDTLWGELVSRTLVAPSSDGSAFAFEHLLLRDFVLSHAGDPQAAHHAALGYYQSLMNELPEEGLSSVMASEPIVGGEAADQAQPTGTSGERVARSVIHHSIALGEFETAARVLVNPQFHLPLMRRGGTAELFEHLGGVLTRLDRLTLLSRHRVRRLAAFCDEVFGHYTAASEFLNVCQAEPGDWVGTPDECFLLLSICSVARKMQQFEKAERAGRSALELTRQLDLLEEESTCLVQLAALERNRNRPAESARLALEAVGVADRTGNLIVRASARLHLARTMLAGDTFVKPQALFTQALDLAREAGHGVLEAQCLESLADLARRQGRNEEGLQRINQALDLHHRLGHRTGEGTARSCRGLILAQMGQQHRAEALVDLRQSLLLAFDLGHHREVASALRFLALVPLPDDSSSSAGRQGRPLGPDTVRTTWKGEPFAYSVACLQTAIGLHDRLGFPRWKKAYRDLTRLRTSAERVGIAWAGVEEAVATDPFTLLQQATGIGAESWRRYLSGADGVLAE